MKEKKIINPEKPNIIISIGDYKTEAEYRKFTSGKKGYGAYGVIKVNNEPYRLSLNLIEM